MNTPRPAGPVRAALSGALSGALSAVALPGALLRSRLTRRMRTRLSALLCALGLLLAGCASFSDAATAFSTQPSLIPNAATVVPPEPGSGAQPSPSSPTPTSPDSSAGSSPDPSESPSTAPTPTERSTDPDSSTAPAPPETDPCAPPELPIVAVCLDEPWGLAPLPDGGSALVGERTTGKIFLVTPEQEPELITTIEGIDPDSGGLLGLALSPYYVEDGLIYAYVSTSSDARIMRFAAGQEAKSIVTGLPRSVDQWGGPIVFGDDGLLYVAAAGGDDGAADAGAGDSGAGDSGAGDSGGDGADDGDDADSGGAAALARSILRYDAFGTPADDNSSGTAVFASGLTDPTGICPLPGGVIGIVDHRGTEDAVIEVVDGGDYLSLESGDTLWTYSAGDEGGVDCAVSDGALLATARSGEKVTRVQMRPQGGFTGTPEAILDGEYGRLRAAVTGPGDLVWLTTRNKTATDTTGDGADDGDTGGGEPDAPDPSDDRVLVLPPSGGGEGGGGVD